MPGRADPAMSNMLVNGQWRRYRDPKAWGTWMNWYIDRKRLRNVHLKRELRMISWRRAI